MVMIIISVACVCSLWAAAHAAAVPFLRTMLPQNVAQRLPLIDPGDRIKLGRLLRSQLYNALAVMCGAVLLWRCQSVADLFLIYKYLSRNRN